MTCTCMVMIRDDVTKQDQKKYVSARENQNVDRKKKFQEIVRKRVRYNMSICITV